MNEITILSVEELKAQLASLPSDVLFRGQTKHYAASDGSVSMLACSPKTEPDVMRVSEAEKANKERLDDDETREAE